MMYELARKEIIWVLQQTD